MTDYTVIWDGTPKAPGGPYLKADHFDPSPVLGDLPDEKPMKSFSLLSPREREALYDECAAGKETCRAIAKRWGVPPTQIYMFTFQERKKRQAHVPARREQIGLF